MFEDILLLFVAGWKLQNLTKNFLSGTQGIMQEFNLGVSSHVSVTLWCEFFLPTSILVCIIPWYCKTIVEIADIFLSFSNKAKIIFSGCAVPVKNTLLVQEIWVLFQRKIGARKYSNETELESQCN